MAMVRLVLGYKYEIGLAVKVSQARDGRFCSLLRMREDGVQDDGGP
jgi:hypothetical protein